MLWTGCAQHPEYNEIQGNAQGTTFQILYHGAGTANYSEEVEQLLTDFDKSLSLWCPDSFISLANAATDSMVRLPEGDEYFAPVLNAALKVRHKTKGAFDPTLYPLVSAWGFGAISPKSDSIPNVQELIAKYHIGGETSIGEAGPDRVLWKPVGMELDFNGIAQGYSVDVLAKMLEEKGQKNYMVEIGGELRCGGTRLGGSPWRISIDRPQAGERVAYDTIDVVNASLATSGSYRKFKERDGKRYSHCIDPRTGYPVEHALLSATVLAPTCMEADAYATAFMVLGVDQTMNMLKGSLGKDLEVLLIYDENGENKTVGTGRFKRGKE